MIEVAIVGAIAAAVSFVAGYLIGLRLGYVAGINTKAAAVALQMAKRRKR